MSNMNRGIAGFSSFTNLLSASSLSAVFASNTALHFGPNRAFDPFPLHLYWKSDKLSP